MKETMPLSEVAKNLGITVQAVRALAKSRGWKVARAGKYGPGGSTLYFVEDVEEEITRRIARCHNEELMLARQLRILQSK